MSAQNRLKFGLCSPGGAGRPASEKPTQRLHGPQVGLHLQVGTLVFALIISVCESSGNAWRTYDLKDVSAAMYKAERKEGLSLDEMNEVLNKKSGMLGISGVSSDGRDLEAAAETGNKRAQLALDVFDYRVIKYIGAYAAAMNGVDAIAFTAGIGENNIKMRKDVCSSLTYLGVKLDEEKNNVRGEERIISADDSKVQVLLVPTNEELAIARETLALVK